MSLYNPEVEKVIATINDNKAKIVCVQLPDGMKPYAKDIADRIETETGARELIWLGSDFGACDIPLGLNRMGIDLLISWGHNKFHKKVGW